MNCYLKRYTEYPSRVVKTSLPSSSANDAECVCHAHGSRYCVDSGICIANGLPQPPAAASAAAPSSYSHSSSGPRRPAEYKSASSSQGAHAQGASSQGAHAQGASARVVNTCNIFPNIELLRNVNSQDIVAQPGMLEMVKEIGRTQSGNNIEGYRVTIPLSIIDEKRTIGIIGISNKKKQHVKIFKFKTQYQQQIISIWIPFNSVEWSTDAAEITSLLTWANDTNRVCGLSGHGPDSTGCTAQALLAVQHDFRNVSTLVAPPQLTNYQGLASAFPSQMVGDKGTMDFALNPHHLLNFISSDNDEFQYIEINTEYLPDTYRFPFYSHQRPVDTGVVLFKKFMLLLKHNNLIHVNRKFVLNNRWAISKLNEQGKFVPQQSAHAQIVAYYIDGAHHYLDVIDTQKADGGNALKARGIGKNFEQALDGCCDIMKTSVFYRLSRSYGIVCSVPKVLLQQQFRINIRTPQELSNVLLNESLKVCDKAIKKYAVRKQSAQAESRKRADPYAVSKELRLSYSGDGPQLLVSPFDLQQAYKSGIDTVKKKLAVPKCNEPNSSLMWIQVMNMQKACFPSLYTGGSFNAANPLVQTNGLWHVLSTCNNISERLALGSLVMIQSEPEPTTMSIATLQRIYNNNQQLLNNMINTFTPSRTPILEIYSVCTSPLYKLKGVCTTLMSQSMIHHINRGTRCFYLGVRLCSLDATASTTDFSDANIGAIKCYLRCGFKFILADGTFWPLYTQRARLLSSLNFRKDLVDAVTRLLHSSRMYVTPGNEMFGLEPKRVLYGHMFCALWPFQGGLSQPGNLVNLSLPSINSDPASRERIIHILGSTEFSDIDQRGKPINWASKLNSPQQFFKFLKELQGGGVFSPTPVIQQVYDQWLQIQEIRNRDVHNETISILMDLLKYSTKEIERKPRRGGKKKSKRNKKSKKNKKSKRNKKSKKNKKSKRKYKRKLKTKIKRKHKRKRKTKKKNKKIK